MLGSAIDILSLPQARWWQSDRYRAEDKLSGDRRLAAAVADFRKDRLAICKPDAAEIAAASVLRLSDIVGSSFAEQFSFSRSSSALYRDSAGMLRAAGIDAPRFDCSTGERRLMLAGSATNLVTARKHNPVDLSNITKAGDSAAVLSLVDDGTALAAAGLSALCTNAQVYKFDNSTGSANAWLNFQGGVASTSDHYLEIWGRGSGSAQVKLNAGNAGGSSHTLASTYQRLAYDQISPSAIGRLLQVVVSAGSIAYLILPGAYGLGTPPIHPISGDTLSAVTRAADTCFATSRISALAARPSFSLALRGRLSSVASGVLWQADDGTSANLVSLSVVSGVLSLIVVSAGATSCSLAAPSPLSAGADFGICCRLAANDFAISVNGGAIAADSEGAMPAAITRAALGRDPAGTSFIAGWIDDMLLWPFALSDSSLVQKGTAYA
jgi:hypothetical protein